MIGLKSVAAVVLGAGLVAIAAWRGALEPAYLTSLSGAACFLVGLLASLAVGLVTIGWRPEVRSRGALTVRRRGLAIVDDAAAPRELPAMIQRVLLLAGMASVALLAIGNHAAARITALPGDLASPSPSKFCMPDKPAAEVAAAAAPAPPPPPVDQPGCALVRRAFKLGYAKTLGACAPRQVIPTAPAAAVAKREVCTRRQLDEPFLHYGYRRVAGAFGALTAVDPVDAIDHRVGDVRAHLDHLDGLLADIRHAITGSPHASHHLWVNLPDPHPGSWRERFTGAPRCGARFADLPLWPRWHDDDGARLVEHVLGQLLFATRFGSTASCNDYVIHWDAPADACARLAADPIAFLGDSGALGSVRAVLDRRRRQLELRELATTLGRLPPAEPPPVASVISLQCFIVDGGAGAAGARAAPTGSSVRIDGDDVAVRAIRVAAVRTADDGPIDVYLAMAALLGGTATAPAPAAAAAPRPDDVDGDDFLLTRLDPLVDADPFAGVRWPLARPDLVEVFPFERHLHAFIDPFRRRYLAQRGRL